MLFSVWIFHQSHRKEARIYANLQQLIQTHCWRDIGKPTRYWPETFFSCQLALCQVQRESPTPTEHHWKSQGLSLGPRCSAQTGPGGWGGDECLQSAFLRSLGSGFCWQKEPPPLAHTRGYRYQSPCSRTSVFTVLPTGLFISNWFFLMNFLK